MLLPCAALALAGCANVVNLTDPMTPRFAGVPPTARTDAEPDTLRIVTFNLKFGRAIDQTIALFQSDQELRNADIIALQEMNETGVRELAQGLGLYYVYYPAVVHPKTHANFGNALLSRWPIEDDSKFVLPYKSWSRRAQRVAVRATVQVGDRRIRVYAIHLAGPFEVLLPAQAAQFGAVLEDAAKSDIPVVIAGDLNSEQLGFEAMSRGFYWPTRKVGATHHMFALDHVFVRGLAVGPDEAGKSDAPNGVSDHRPVWVAVHLPPTRLAHDSAAMAHSKGE